MKVFEVTNGYMGFSYMRCQVLANNENEAIEKARIKYIEIAKKNPLYDEKFYNNLKAELILDENNDVSEVED